MLYEMEFDKFNSGSNLVSDLESGILNPSHSLRCWE